MRNVVILSALLTASLVSQAEAANWEVNQIPAPLLGALPFGETVAVSRDGNTALIASPREACADGRNCGAAYVYIREGQAWRLQARLSASDEKSDIRFGGNDFDDNTIALSADGNIAFVGIDPSALGKGAIYVFLRNGEIWSEQQKLVRPDASETGTDGFGRSVALSDFGDTAIVGDAPSAFNFGSGPKGTAYVFTRVDDRWIAQARLTGSRTEHGNGRASAFGRAVAISGDGGTAVVGSPGYPTDLLEAYVFTEHKGQWREQAILNPADPATADSFGHSIAISRSGETVVVGTPDGAAYIFQQNGHHGTWWEEAKLGSTITDKSRLGFSVDIDDTGRNAVVGDWGSGTAFLFHREEDFKSRTAKWVPDRLLSKVGGVGSSVTISGDANTVLVGYGVYALHRQ